MISNDMISKDSNQNQLGLIIWVIFLKYNSFETLRTRNLYY